jgi:hypothetical protein
MTSALILEARYRDCQVVGKWTVARVQSVPSSVSDVARFHPSD